MWMSEEAQAFAQAYKQTASGLLVPEHIKTRKHPIGFDFFAGAGGFSLGFIQAGFEMIGACEWAPDAAQTYLANLGNHPVQMIYSSPLHRKRFEEYFEKQYKTWLKNTKDKLIAPFPVSGSAWIKSERASGNIYPGVSYFFAGDICDLTGEMVCRHMNIEVGELDVVIGGPPCQGFSTASGRNREKKATDPRNILVFQYARMICELKPKSFAMEEVPEILKMRTAQGVPVIDQFLRILEDGNFMSYESGMKALNIREKEIGAQPKYVTRPTKDHKVDYTNKKKPEKIKAKPVLVEEKQFKLF